jgi:hypothetical protein
MKAAYYRAYAAVSLADAEAAGDKITRDVQLAIARHFYLLAEIEICRFEGRPYLNRDCDPDPIL